MVVLYEAHSGPARGVPVAEPPKIRRLFHSHPDVSLRYCLSHLRSAFEVRFVARKPETLNLKSVTQIPKSCIVNPEP